MTADNVLDCTELGRAYWRLRESVDRATITDPKSGEKLLSDFANRYVASVNPMEVSDRGKLLQQLNEELEKPQVNPGFAFVAGQQLDSLASWILSHCPAELAWGHPTKEYTSALGACSALEPELRRFERNTLRVISMMTTGQR